MKNISIILFSVLYLFIASGLTLRLHYCGDKLKNISLNARGSEEGCCGNKKKSKRCCHEKTASVKIKDSHRHVTGQKVPSDFKVNDFCLNTALSNFSQPISAVIAPDYHAPPIVYRIPIFIFIRVLLI